MLEVGTCVLFLLLSLRLKAKQYEIRSDEKNNVSKYQVQFCLLIQNLLIGVYEFFPSSPSS